MITNKFIKKVSLDLRSTPIPIPQKIAMEIAQADSDTIKTLPQKKNLEKRIYRKMKKLEPVGSKVLINKENIIKFDFFVNEKRVIGLSTNFLLSLLPSSHTLTCDGTFKIVPSPFLQLFIIYSFNGSFHIPCAFFLLCEKSKVLYQEVFRKLKEYCFESMNLVLNPKQFVTDFENAILSAISLEFPNTQLQGCYFHFNQAIIKNLSKLQLKKLYKKNTFFFTLIKMLTSLAYLPINDVIQAFNELKTLISERFPEAVPFLQYFENHWINNISPHIWSVCSRVLTTNNHAEGYNKKVKDQIGRRRHHLP